MLTAQTPQGNISSVPHFTWPAVGKQRHPWRPSVLLCNWLGWSWRGEGRGGEGRSWHLQLMCKLGHQACLPLIPPPPPPPLAPVHSQRKLVLSYEGNHRISFPNSQVKQLAVKHTMLVLFFSPFFLITCIRVHPAILSPLPHLHLAMSCTWISLVNLYQQIFNTFTWIIQQ